MIPYRTIHAIVIDHDHIDRESYFISRGKWWHVKGHTWDPLGNLDGLPRQACTAEDVIVALLTNISKEGSLMYAFNRCGDILSIQDREGWNDFALPSYSEEGMRIA